MWCVIYQWNGGIYAEAFGEDLDAESVEEAVEIVEGWEADLDKWFEAVDGVIDVRVDIYEEDGSVIAEQVYLRRNVGMDKTNKMLKEAEAYWTNESEFSTEYLIHFLMDDPEWGWYHVRLNGGTKGAFDRTCGDGEWRERYDLPNEIRYSEATKLAKEWGLEDFPFPREEDE